MMLENLKMPTRLIHSDLKIFELIYDIHYLKYQTQIGVKKQSLLNCIIEDNQNHYHKIIDIIDLGPKGPWWRFEFFNPMKRVELKFSMVVDEVVLNEIKELLNSGTGNILN